MKYIDKFLQKWRIAVVRPFIPHGSYVLDIGSADGVMFQLLYDRIEYGVGIDHSLSAPIVTESYILLPGNFPQDLTQDTQRPYNIITALAVLEHIPPKDIGGFARACVKYLDPNGWLILTVPSPKVDKILWALESLHIIDRMSLEEHFGFLVSQTPNLFESEGLTMVLHKKFQLSLNNLFIFSKSGKPIPQKHNLTQSKLEERFFLLASLWLIIIVILFALFRFI